MPEARDAPRTVRDMAEYATATFAARPNKTPSEVWHEVARVFAIAQEGTDEPSPWRAWEHRCCHPGWYYASASLPTVAAWSIYAIVQLVTR